ncbi:hypothetical protein HPB48_000014 [Haemaphysalis longicornis]|uniref:ATP-dependent DNA helicase n=1 Tax=Haemaphysalis longicornis TaxID=44386 RepID=A0A9J6GHL8_HAELO|nr:hypothetical protein HPB48_000014 [Haemaphysalis longicornis]
MDRDEYCNLMRMTNAEQHNLLREIIHRQTTPSAPPLRVFLTGPAGCGKAFVLRLAMDLNRRYSNTVNNTAYNAFALCASTGKAAVAVGGTTVHAAFKLSGKTTGPNKDGGISASESNTFRVAFQNVKCVIIDESGGATSQFLQSTGGVLYIPLLPEVSNTSAYKRTPPRNSPCSSLTNPVCEVAPRAGRIVCTGGLAIPQQVQELECPMRHRLLPAVVPGDGADVGAAGLGLPVSSEGAD